MNHSTIRHFLVLLGAGAAAIIIGATPATAATPRAPVDAQVAGKKTVANPPIVFAQTKSDLAVDPAARFGRLPNGMTYVIYKNGTPPGEASVWMRVAAGSIMEQENQRGLAHFVEHMAFKGSKNVPEGEMVKLLERDGLRFGADTNASTSHFQTLYTLNLPDSSQRIVGDALFLMRETAGNINFDPDAINRERGVILGEERVRSTTDSRAGEAQTAYLLRGTKYADRLPIGLVDVIKTAQRPAFLQFYNDFYRPEYTTLIVAGDVDPDRVEADIRKRFSDWHPGSQSPAALTDFGTLSARNTPEAKVFASDGLAGTMGIYWLRQPVDNIETKASQLEEQLYSIAASVLNNRFARAASAPSATFFEASLERQDIKGTTRLYGIGISPKEGQDRAASDQVIAIFREFLANGPTQDELDRTLIKEEQRHRDGVAKARTIPSKAIAGLIVEALTNNGVIQTPAQALDQFEAVKPTLTLAAVNKSLHQMKLDESPTLWRQGEQAKSFDEDAMLSAYKAAMEAPLTSFAAGKIAPWPYTQFGTPSAVVSQQALPDVGATLIKFANGVSLMFKQTRFQDNVVHVSVQLGNGYLGIRRDQGATLFMAKQVGLYKGGLGKLSSHDIGQALLGKVFGLGFGIGTNAATLSGQTTKADLGAQMQVLTAFMTDPGFRPEALDGAKDALPVAYDEARTSPNGVYSLMASGNFYSDDPRFAAPLLRDAMAVSNDSVSALLRDQLGHGPVDATIVGDITLEEAIAQVAPTLGALPPLPPAVTASDVGNLQFPTRNLHRVYTHSGRPDQNLSVIAWPTTDYYADPRRAVALDLLAAVMAMRELAEVRVKQSATYSVSAISSMSRSAPGFGFVTSRADVRPEVDDTYYKTVSAIAEELKTHLVGADEFTRVRQPFIERIRNERNSNQYWLGLLSGTTRDPRKIADLSTREKYLLSMTPQDIQNAAISYLEMPKAMRIQVKPGSEASE